MKKILWLSCFAFFVIRTGAQAPAIIKSVGGAVTEPVSKDQEGWKSNEWNGLFFYQGTGTPSKLCVTDGTSAGTVYLADVGSGTIVATIPAQDFMFIITSRIASFSPILYEAQIWKSDGTASGTSLVYTMPQSSISNACIFTSDRDSRRNFSVSGNTMFFGGYDAVNGNELWITDGTATGTHIVKDIKAGTGNSLPWAFCKIGSDVFFTCMQTGLERKLWKTDGTAAGTVQVAVAEPFYILDNAVGIVNNKMIFYAHNTVDGYEPYVSDGTAAGTFMLKDINTGGNSWLSQSQNAHLRFNSKYCFFIAYNGSANALWRTDGTSSGTIQLTSNAQAAFSGVSGGSYTDVDESGLWMIEYNSAGSGSNEKIYRSDGTVAGTYQVATGLSYAQYLKIFKGALWMASRNTGSVANVEPWRSGGNAATTGKAFEIAPGTSGSPLFTPISANPFGFFVKNNKLYFFASSNASPDRNLYQYTGNFTFNGSLAGGKWKDSVNWNSQMPPGITDTVFVNAGTPNVLNLDGGYGYAGVLNLGNNANINLLNLTDTLVINNRINAQGNNTLGFDGAIAFKNISGDTVRINGGFETNNIAVQSPASVVSGTMLLYAKISFTGGKLFLNDNNFRLHINGNGFGSANNYFVTNGTGAVAALNLGAGLNNLPKFIPVGTVSDYAPVTITNTGDVDTFTVRVINAVNQNYTAENPSGLPFATGAVNHTWFINEGTPGGSDATVTLQWNAARELPLFNRAQTYLGHYTGGIWDYGTQGTAAGTDPYSFSRSGLHSFSPFGILNSNAILPLNFISFNAQKCSSKQVCLSWRTGNEQHVSYFEIERSTDGVNFVKAGSHAANNQSQNSYATTDDISSFTGNTSLYYRVRAVEKSGVTKLSNTGLVRWEQKAVTVYPTLVSYTFTVKNDAHEKMQLRLLDTEGKLVLLKNIDPGINSMNTAMLAVGTYLYQVYDSNGLMKNSGKIIKQ